MIAIRIAEGHIMDGEGEPIGQGITFWRSEGHLNVPRELAIKLEKETPQRFEIVDRDLAEKLLNPEEEPEKDDEAPAIPPPPVEPKVEEPVLPPVPPPPVADNFEDIPTKKFVNSMTKDQLNDWAAKRDYNLNQRDRRGVMIKKLCQQIKDKTGMTVK